MEDFGSAAATKAALLLVIGEPVSEDHKHLIPEELAKGRRHDYSCKSGEWIKIFFNV